MRSPPSSSRRSSRGHRSVTEFGSRDHIALRASGLYQTTSVQDRIKQWQAYGAASAPPPDAVSVLSAPRSEMSATPEPQPTEDPNHNRQAPRVIYEESRNGHTDTRQTRQPSQMRSSSTPRKRVISDEHWKAKQTSKREVRFDTQGSGGEETVIPSSVLSEARTERSFKTSKQEREERRRRRVEARSSRILQAANGSKPPREAHGPHEHSKALAADSAVRKNYDGYVDPNEDANTEVSRKVTSELSESSDVEEGHNPDSGTRRKSRYAEILSRPPPTYQDAQLRSKKGSLLTKTKQVLGMVDPLPAVSNRLPSIEAWLDDQPDPFMESTHSKVHIKNDELRLPRSRSERFKTPKSNQPLRDPNQIWKAIDEPKGLDNNLLLRGEHEEHRLHAQAESKTTAPANLQRRGARAKRTKRNDKTSTMLDTEDVQAAVEDKARDAPDPISACSADFLCPQAGPTELSKTSSIRRSLQVDSNCARPDLDEFKGKFTTHEDMMTVLSRPSLRKSTRRKHNVRTGNHRQSTDQIKGILDQLAIDEAQYIRELKTLVDGVIPVLLQCVLSKSDAVAAADFFTNSTENSAELSFGRPVIDMGIALERLKTLHNRIALDKVDSFFSWCQSAHKAYTQYLKAWRLGFQDIVVNLAPLDDSDGEGNEVMERDAKGDIVDSKGQAVDIAYLMKRPLVNIRKLGRVLSSIQEELPDHPIAERIAEDFRDLTAAAKTKHQQEKGRLEDEAAANIDVTKCRDLRNLAPLPGVSIDRAKRVRARDCFNLTLFHSTGQRMDCQIEIVLRDDQQNTSDGGDLLICQIEENGKWLLFAPVKLSQVSARKGELGCDLVIMIRGKAGMGQEWRELFALQVDEAEAISEWMIMLGSNPLPPKLSGIPSFLDLRTQAPLQEEPETVDLSQSALRNIPSTETVDIPIGEPSVLGTVAAKSEEECLSVSQTTVLEKPMLQLNMGGGLQKKHIPEHWQTLNSASPKDSFTTSIRTPARSTISGTSVGSSSVYTPSSLAPMEQDRPAKQQVEKSHNVAQHKRYGPQVMPVSDTSQVGLSQLPSDPKSVKETNLVEESLVPQQLRRDINVELQQKHELEALATVKPAQATSEEQTASLPLASKPRASSLSSTPLTEAIRDTWSAISGFGRKAVKQPTAPDVKAKSEAEFPPVARRNQGEQNVGDIVPPHDNEPIHIEAHPPVPPQHKTVPILRPRPVLRPSAAQIKMDRQNGRLSYSPLRHEYTPSSASTSETSDSDPSFASDDDSQTSEDNQDERYSHPLPTKSSPSKLESHIAIPPPHSVTTTGARTLAPSDSASQGPYRQVPSSAERPHVPKKRTIAMVCSWNENGLWDPLVEEHCSIVVSPGLIEAFLMGKSDFDVTTNDQRPLAAFELTPLVPLRRPTGLDINIRSPPTLSSQIQTSNNIMFRTRSAMECESLYQMINWARCNNPTYMELERSRPRPQPVVTFSTQEAPRPRSWFSFGGVGRRNSYRVGNIPPSSMGESQATANTTSSAMSALRRLTKSSSFNVNRSSVIRRRGVEMNESLYSSSNRTGDGSNKSTPPPSQLGMIPGKDGPNVPPTSNAALNGGGMVHNMKIRLQVRESQGWVTMGVSRLTILPAVKRSDDSPEVSRPNSPTSAPARHGPSSRRASTITGSVETQQHQLRLASSNYTPHRLHGGGREKRVVVTWEKDPTQILLDATLGESCFEKINHLGIAVQVWTPYDEVKSRGGVLIGQNTKYLFQFFTAKECAWVFELVGKYRYGNSAD